MAPIFRMSESSRQQDVRACTHSERQDFADKRSLPLCGMDRETPKRPGLRHALSITARTGDDEPPIVRHLGIGIWRIVRCGCLTWSLAALQCYAGE